MTADTVLLAGLGLILLVAVIGGVAWARGRTAAARPADPAHDLGQDPRPEPQWFFRRIYTWFVTVTCLALAGALSFGLPDADRQTVVLAVLGLSALLSTLYLVAPSAPELTALVTALRLRFGRDGGPPPPPPGDPGP